MIKELEGLTAVSGCEDEVREFIKASLAESGIEYKTDSIGNIKAAYGDETEIIVAAHMDEAGFIITEITDDGYLKFAPIGKIKPSAVLSKQVKINGITGIVSFKAVHLTSKEEREKPVDISKLYIDIGAKTKAEAEKYAEVGDLAAFVSGFKELGTDYISGKALERAGCETLTDILKAKRKGVCGIYTVLDKVAHRGLKVAANNTTSAKAALIIGCAEADEGIELGKGAVIEIYQNASAEESAINNKIVKSAAEIQIKTCDKSSAAAAFKSVRADIPVITLSIPCRNTNTDVCIVNTSDIKTLFDAVNSAIDIIKEEDNDRSF